jgi:hypothetical protein
MVAKNLNYNQIKANPYVNRILCLTHMNVPFQIQNNWSYGEVLDENAKTHPMLRPYKTFSEKVGPQSGSSSTRVPLSCPPSLSLCLWS